MDIKDIRRLLSALADSDVREFSYDTGDYKLSVKRGAETVISQAGPYLETSAAAVPAAVSSPATPAVAASAADDAAASPNAGFAEVIAPIVGTFYASASPDSPPYVKVGDRVKAGQVLCIIEAMKLMNEIEAEVGGVLREIAVNNEEPVEYGQVLFRIEPD